MSLVNRRGVRNPAVRSIVWPRGSTTCLGCGTCLLVTWEADKHEQKAARRQSSTRPDSAFNGSEDSHRGESSAGGDDKRDRLDGAVGVGRTVSAEHIDKCRRAPPALTRLGRGDDSQGHARCHLARVGGSHPLLRPGTVRVWLDGDGVEPRLHDLERFRGADGRGGHQAHQPVRSEVGGRGETGGPERRSGRYDSAGGGHPLSQRDGVDGGLSHLSPGSEQTCRRDVQAIRLQGEGEGPSGPREGAGVSSVRQRQIEGGEEQDGGADGNHHPGNQRAVGASSAGGEHHRPPGEEAWHRGRREVGPTATDDGPVTAADSILAEDGICRSGQNHQSANSRAILNRPREGWKNRGVWAELGHHPTSRRLPAGAVGDESTRASRHEVCGEGGGRSYRPLRESTACLGLRPWWLEQRKRREAQEAGRQRSGPGPPRPCRMGGERVDKEEAGERAGEGGGGNRGGEKQPIQFPPTASAVGADDGSVWANGGSWFQSEQTRERARSERADDVGRMKRANCVEFTNELENGDQHGRRAERRAAPLSHARISRLAVANPVIILYDNDSGAK